MSFLTSIGQAFIPNRVLSSRAVAIITGVWACAALAVWINSPFEVLPQPLEVLRALGGLWQEQGLSHELWTSFALNIEALAISTVLSLGLAYLTVVPFFRPLVMAISKGRFLGLIGLTFAFTLMVGGGRPLKLALLVFGMTVFFVTSMAAVVASIPKARFDLARTLRMSEWRVVWEVVVLGNKAEAVEMLRQNAAIGWMMLTMVEGISRSEGGVGAMLLNQNKHFQIDAVFAVQFLILGLGLLQDYGIGVIKRIISPYAALKLERG